MKKDAYYFSHDANARKDEKILTLLALHGYEGYGLYWCLIEMMFENQDTAISRKLLKGIAYDLRVDLPLLQKVITTCYNVKLFAADKEKIWSESLRRRKSEWDEKKKKRSEAGARGNAVRWGISSNAIAKKSQTDRIAIAKHRKVKESKVKERKYIPPTLDEVKKFFSENGYSQESAIKAFKYYEDGNWHDGKGNQVKNWKQKMRGVWFKDENQSKSSTSVNGYLEQRRIDEEKLQAKLSA